LDGDNFNYEQVGQGREEKVYTTRHHHGVHQAGLVGLGWYGVLLLHHNGVDYIDE